MCRTLRHMRVQHVPCIDCAQSIHDHTTSGSCATAFSQDAAVLKAGPWLVEQVGEFAHSLQDGADAELAPCLQAVQVTNTSRNHAMHPLRVIPTPTDTGIQLCYPIAWGSCGLHTRSRSRCTYRPCPMLHCQPVVHPPLQALSSANAAAVTALIPATLIAVTTKEVAQPSTPVSPPLDSCLRS